MKFLTPLLIFLFMTTAATAQGITGDWYGILNVQGMELKVAFHISETEEGYTATMDSPQQNAFGIPISDTQFKENVLQLKAPQLGLQYQGTLKDTLVSGIFSQGGMQLPLELSKEKWEEKKIVRPQEPKKPYPYLEEEVIFHNMKDSVSLSGTLTLPKKEGKYPAVILISGSGPQDRNEAILNHKPFLVIADHLTRNGIAVLRYDDRGVAKSTGDFSSATSEDFAEDVKAGIEYLKSRKEIDHEDIGLVGHSEGGLIAPIVAAENEDVSFLVLLAGPGLRGDKVLLLQQELIYTESGESEEKIRETIATSQGAFDIIRNSPPQELEANFREYLEQQMDKEIITDFPEGMDKEKILEKQVESLLTPWFRFFITHDPAETLQKVKVPVLAINGENDLQVASKENLEAIERALTKGGNQNVTIKEYPGLNHLFQESETGSPKEYAGIEQTISPEVLEDITNWILKASGE